MNGLNPNSENGIIGPELKPDSRPATLNIKVAHGLNQHEVAVPSNSTFGDLKSVIVQKIGLKPETHKVLFRGKEKDDDEFLQTAGVKDNCKVLLMENTACREKGHEEVKETNVISRGGAAVVEVREEVDMLADQVAALQAVVDSGTKVDSKDIIYLTEMLMRQLLKLDGIEAEGEGRVQRKMEVRRVQSFVETMDILKSRNLNPFSNDNNTASVTTQWETFEAGSGSASNMSAALSSASTAPSSTPTPHAIPVPSSMPTPHPIPIPSSTPTPIPPSTPTPHPIPVPSSTPTPIPPSTSTPALTPSSMPSPAPVASSTPTPVPFTIPTSTHVPSSASSLMPSSTKVTQEWEHFD